MTTFIPPSSNTPATPRNNVLRCRPWLILLILLLNSLMRGEVHGLRTTSFFGRWNKMIGPTSTGMVIGSRRRETSEQLARKERFPEFVRWGIDVSRDSFSGEEKQQTNVLNHHLTEALCKAGQTATPSEDKNIVAKPQDVQSESYTNLDHPSESNFEADEEIASLPSSRDETIEDISVAKSIEVRFHERMENVDIPLFKDFQTYAKSLPVRLHYGEYCISTSVTIWFVTKTYLL